MKFTKLKEILEQTDEDSIDRDINLWLSKNKDTIIAKQNERHSSSFVPYPDIGSESFSREISGKYEFYKSRYLEDSFSLTTCSNTIFKRTLNQEFVKNFLSPQTPYNSLLLFHGVGVGKCFAKGTRILMFDGTWKNVENVKMSDFVMGDDSTHRKVTSIVRGYDYMYLIKPEWGKSYVVNSDHILCCKKLTGDNVYEDVNISVKDYLKLTRKEKEVLYGYRSKLVLFSGKDDNNSPSSRMSYLRHLISNSGRIHRDYIELDYDFVGYEYALSNGIGCFRNFDHMYLFGKQLKFLGLSIPHNVLNKSVYFKFDIFINDVVKHEYYGFSVDGNHKFIIEDFIVTHNSCSAVLIAEQFHDVFNKKTLVLMPPNLKDNFTKQIFNINAPERSCTNNTYFTPEKYVGMSNEMIEKKVNKLIHSKYEIKGFIEFANYVNNLSKNEKQKIQLIREQFSDRVIIIDEVHNIRDEEKTDKFVPPIIKEVLKYANNVKLVLLSATPMYNKASEIIEIVNFLRINDKKKPIEQSDVFDKESLSARGKEILRKSITGYVSYMRGENPFTFPMRLFPPEATNEIVKDLLLVPCKMSEFQSNTYLSTFEKDEKAFKKNTQLSNICYPTKEYGKAGLNSIFNISENPFTLEYKDKVKEKIFSKEHIAKYSAKIDFIADKISKSEGIIFVYSFYISSGIIPLALALEHRGFNRYGQANILQNPGKVENSKFSYTILTPQRNLSPNVEADLEVCKSKENANGEKIKVVIASSIASEGFDFKNIREVYILEPWWHLNKIEQIIGRAVRNCSHIDLPLEKRNVTIYQLVNVSDVISDEDQIDIKMYQTSAEKQRTMNEVEDILKESSIDCHLNKNVMFYNTKKKIDIVTAQNIKKTVFLKDDGKRYKPIKCLNEHAGEDPSIKDKSTYDVFFFKDEIENMSNKISDLYLDHVSLSYGELYDLLDDERKEDVLPFILNYLIDYKVPVGDKLGYLIYRGLNYIYQPFNNNNLGLPLEDRKQTKKYTKLGLKISAPSMENKSGSETKIHKKVEDEIKALQTRIGTEFFNHFKEKDNVILEYVLDRLTTEDLFQLVIEPEFSKEMKKTLESANTLIYHDNEVFIKDRISKKLYVKDIVGSFKEASEFQKMKLDAAKKLRPSVTTGQQGIIGYIHHELNKKKNVPTVFFKIIVQDKKNSSGTVCYRTTTLQRNMLIDMILDKNKRLAERNFEKINKPGLCDIYELSLRLKPDVFLRS